MNNKEHLRKDLSLTEAESRTLSILRILSMFGVIATHIYRVLPVDTPMETAVSQFWGFFGHFSVICFFILGGFLYQRHDGDGKTFWRKKLFTLILPWLVCSLITFLISCWQEGQITLLSYVQWVFGFNSWYYYIHEFLVFLFFFKWLRKHDALLFLCMGLTVVSVSFYHVYPKLLEGMPVYPFLNPLNWVGFFALGVLMRKYRLDRRIIGNPVAVPVCLLVALPCLVGVFLWKRFDYFTLLSIPWELALTVLVWSLAHVIAKLPRADWLSSFGDDTYCVYLLHMQIVQFLAGRMPPSIWSHIFNPILNTVFMFALVAVCKWLVCRLPLGGYLCKIVGLRPKIADKKQKSQGPAH